MGTNTAVVFLERADVARTRCYLIMHCRRARSFEQEGGKRFLAAHFLAFYFRPQGPPLVTVIIVVRIVPNSTRFYVLCGALRWGRQPRSSAMC